MSEIKYFPQDGDKFTGSASEHQISTKTHTDHSEKAFVGTLTFDNFSLVNKETPLYFYNPGTETGDIKETDDVILLLYGDNSLTATNNSGQRGMSSSATKAVEIIGYDVNDKMATLTLITTQSTKEPLKGYYNVTNANIVVEYQGKTANMDKIVIVGDGLNIIERGSFSMNNVKVELKPLNNNKLKMNLGTGQPGKGIVTITALEGGTLQGVTVTGAKATLGDGNITFTMPSIPDGQSEVVVTIQ